MNTAQDYSLITTLRHEMHIMNDDAWKYNELLESLVKAIEELKLAPPHLLKSENADCGDWECTGCLACREASRKAISQVKEDNNHKIELWMLQQEKRYGLEGEIAPSGEARARWAASI
jgi:hypothetical protein